jgi:hypothetical protein
MVCDDFAVFEKGQVSGWMFATIRSEGVVENQPRLSVSGQSLSMAVVVP